MLLKKETLLQWIAIIEAGELDPEIVKIIENIRSEEKRKRNNKHRNSITSRELSHTKANEKV